MLSVLSQSCDYLDIVPDNTVEIKSIFENKESAYSALAACYSFMPNNEQINNSMNMAGDEWVIRLDAGEAGNPDRILAEKLMRGWQNSNDPLLSFWNGGKEAPSLYQAIRVCNIFLENIEGVPDLSEDEKMDWIGQVKILKAFYHFYLIRLYGPIIIVDTNLESSAGVEEVRMERKPVEECFQYVISLINSVLYDDSGNSKTDLVIKRENLFLGQIDQIIAKALKAQVMLYRASPLFNGNVEYYSNFKGYNGEMLFPMDNDKEKWKEALDAIKEAIDIAHENGKKLYTYNGQVKFWDQNYWKESDIIQYCYNNRFAITEPWNDELIWGFSNLNWSGQGSMSHASQMRSLAEPGVSDFSWQWLGASYRMTELFHTRNGVPIRDDITFDYENRLAETVIPGDSYHKGYMQEGESTIKLHLNREPRFYSWIVVDRCIWRTHDIINDVKMRYNERPGGRNSSHNTDFYWSAVAIKKLIHPESRNWGWERVVKFPYPIIRLADLYLMYAEAYNEYYGPDAAVFEMLNTVRRRAGLLRPIQETWADASIVKNPGKHTTQNGLRDIIHTERLIELCFEGQRYFDILRWKRAGEFFVTPIKGWNASGVTPEQFYELQTLQPREWQIPKNYLFPIPLSDMNRNPKLVQNPGW